MENTQKSYTFTHRADCVLRCVDAASGRPLDPGRVQLAAGGKTLHPMRKPEGFLVLMNLPRVPFTVEITAEGYEPEALPITFDEDGGAPVILDVHLLPVPGLDGDGYRVLAGSEKDLEAVDAVLVGENACLAREFEKRRSLLKVFNPHRLQMDMRYYAIVDPDSATYEALEITRRLSDEEFIVTPPVQRPISPHFPLTRRVLARLDAGGGYRLVLRRSAGRRWLVRYRAGGQERFEAVDLDGEAGP